MRTDFELTRKAKRKARQLRKKKERVWRKFRISCRICTFTMLITAIISCIYFRRMEYMRFLAFAIPCFIAYVVWVSVWIPYLGFASHWLQDRLDERLWAENGKINHVFRKMVVIEINGKKIGGGFVWFEYEIASIRKVKYDPASKRIELDARGTFKYFLEDLDNPEAQWDIDGPSEVFYDCSSPSFAEFLRSCGIPFEETTFNFKIKDTSL